MPPEELASFVSIAYTNNSVITVAYDEYESVNAAWETGRKRWSGLDEWGEEVTIALKGIQTIVKQSGESRKKYHEDQSKIEKLRNPII